MRKDTTSAGLPRLVTPLCSNQKKRQLQLLPTKETAQISIYLRATVDFCFNLDALE